MQDNFHPEDLISEAEKVELRDSGVAVSNQFWAWGDFTARKCALAPADGLMRLYDYIGTLIGRSGRSVRYYREVAEFFPAEIREAYQPLPFDTFKLAKSYGAHWRLVLDTALGYSDSRGGRLPTREWLEMRLRPMLSAIGAADVDGTPPLDVEDVFRTADVLADVQPGPDPVYPDDPGARVAVAGPAVRVAIRTFSSFTRQFARSLDGLRLRSETRDLLQTALAALTDAIQKVEQDLGS